MPLCTPVILGRMTFLKDSLTSKQRLKKKKKVLCLEMGTGKTKGTCWEAKIIRFV